MKIIPDSGLAGRCQPGRVDRLDRVRDAPRGAAAGMARAPAV